MRQVAVAAVEAAPKVAAAAARLASQGLITRSDPTPSIRRTSSTRTKKTKKTASRQVDTQFLLLLLA